MWAGAALILGGLLLAACGGSEPQVQRVNTPSLVPLTPVTRPTLPPAWTPTPSETPSLMPTVTAAPTQTPTFTITPTLTAREVCQQFVLTVAPSEGVAVDYDGIIGFSWEGAPPDSIIALSMVDHTGEETLVQFSPDFSINTLFDLTALPTWGTYDWTLSLVLPPYGELCPQTGSFLREPWWADPFDNPLAPPFAN